MKGSPVRVRASALSNRNCLKLVGFGSAGACFFASMGGRWERRELTSPPVIAPSRAAAYKQSVAHAHAHAIDGRRGILGPRGLTTRSATSRDPDRLGPAVARHPPTWPSRP